MHSFCYKSSISLKTINPIVVVKEKGYRVNLILRTYGTMPNLFWDQLNKLIEWAAINLS
jgi:hypothetical protein